MVQYYTYSVVLLLHGLDQCVVNSWAPYVSVKGGGSGGLGEDGFVAVF